MLHNSGYLMDMACPQCHQHEKLVIRAEITVVVQDDFIEEESGYEWTDESDCWCEACGYIGAVKDFLQKEQP